MSTRSVARPKASRPWSKISPELRNAMLLGSGAPAVLSLAFWMSSGLDFIVILLTVFLPLQLLGGAFAGFRGYGARGILDGLLVVVTIFLATFVIVMLLSVVWSVFVAGFQTLSPHFIYQNNRYVSPTADLSFGGLGHALVGTVFIVTFTTAITVPLGVATAVYITETQGKSRGLIRTLLQAMSGLPSVVAGLFIYSVFIASGITSYAGYAGSLALVPLMLPTVARVAEESLLLVPRELRNGALALGAPSWRAFYMVTLPAAKSGMVTAVLLGIARIIGETAPLLLTIFSNNATNWNMFEGGMASLPTYLFLNLSLGTDSTIARAWGAAAVIMILVAVVFSLARIISSPKKARRQGSRT